MMKMSKGLVLLLSIVAAVCELGNCTEYTAVYDAEGRRQCAVGQPDDFRSSTNKATLECLRLCDDNPECVVFNLYDNTTCEIFTCSSKSSLDYEIVDACKSLQIHDCQMRCSQPECGDLNFSVTSGAISTLSVGEYEVSTGEATTCAEETTYPIDATSVEASSTLNIGEYEVTTATTYAEETTFPIDSSSVEASSTLNIGEYEVTTGIDPPSSPRDCADVRAAGNTESGVYVIKVGNSGNETSVYCDMSTSGSWLVFQRRLDGSVDFEKNWNDYANGFGNLTGEFWLGNELLYNLLANGNYRLRIDIEDWNGGRAYAEYFTFSIASANENYALSVGDYSEFSTTGDSLSDHNWAQFSTWDADNDDETQNMAVELRGGWWHNYFDSSSSRLNGVYINGGLTQEYYGIVWYAYSDTDFYSLRKTEMKIAPWSFKK